MWYYIVAHVTYHFTRWFPKDARTGVSLYIRKRTKWFKIEVGVSLLVKIALALSLLPVPSIHLGTSFISKLHSKTRCIVVWPCIEAFQIFTLLLTFPHYCPPRLKRLDNNLRLMRMFCIITSLVFLIPQFIILLDDQSARYCNQPLLNMLVASIMMSSTMIAFTFLFTMMEPVPWKLKIAFHFFGFFSMLLGLIQFGVTVGSTDCNFNTPRLYYISMSLGIFAFVATLFVTILLPFWMINYFWPNAVLNRKERRGMCYEPVKCCSCLWHV